MKLITIILALGLAANAQKSLEDRVSELEAQQSLNIFNFSGYLESYYDNIKAKQSATTSTSALDDKTDYLRLRAGININATVSEKTKFYSKIVASKFMNKMTTQGTYDNSFTPDLSEGRRFEEGSSMFLEKAYADVSLSEGLVFSFGRLSTVEGPHTQMAYNKDRMGTYPYLAYNSILDGFAFTYNHKGSESTASGRLIYTPLQTYNRGSLTTPPYLAQTTVDGAKVPNLTDILAYMAEYQTSAGPIAKNLNIIFMGYVTQTRVGVNSLSSSAKTALEAGIKQGCVAGLPTGYPASTCDAITSSGSINAGISANNLTVELADIAGIGVDLGASYIQTEIANKGAINYTLGGQNIYSIYGLGAAASEEKTKGATSVVNLKYNINSNNAIGYETLNGGKGVFIYAVGALDLTGYYTMSGTAEKFYYSTKLLNELSLNLSYAKQKYKYAAPSFGAIAESDKTVDNYTAMLRLEF